MFLKKDLDIGESAAIALAVERKAKMILLDENDARNIAEIYNLHKIGVIGILMRAKNRDLIKEGQAISGQSQSRGKFLDQPESL